MIQLREVTDLDLLERYRAGDPTALDELVSRYEPLVFRTCKRIVDHEADAQDMTQEVFLQFLNCADRINRNVPGWLYRCAVNRSRSRIRSIAARAGIMNALPPVHFRSHRHSRRARSNRAKCSMPASRNCRKRSWTWCFHAHLLSTPQADIARHLGISQQAVSKRLRKATARLRQSLNRRGVVAPAGALAAIFGGTLTVGVSAVRSDGDCDPAASHRSKSPPAPR